MRYVYMALIVALVAVLVMFKIQNLQTVTVSLFSASFTMPVSLMVLLIYVLGAFTGGFVLAFLRSGIRGAIGKE